MLLHNEEDVKIHTLPGMLSERGYDPTLAAYNVPITVKQGRKSRTIFADVVVYGDDAKTTPLLVVETKPPNMPITDDDRDQAISYARLTTPIPPITLLTNGSPAGTKAFDTYTRREFKDGLPSFDEATTPGSRKSKAKVEALAAEATHEIFKVDNVQEYKRILRASHNAIRNNEGYDPTKAFDELSKVMFTKLYEEKSGKKNRFRLSEYDDLQKRGVNIIQEVFKETKNSKKFRGLFVSESSIELSDRTIRELVSQFENYDLSLTDFDVKGEAFEHFLGDTFTGGLGQYFTPRNVVKFVVDALDPGIGQRVIDPFCGTGGFLINWHQAVDALIDSSRTTVAKRDESRRELGEDCLFGIDWNERTSLACRMNMVVHGEGDSGRHIFMQSGFSNVKQDEDDADSPDLVGSELFDVCVTNPPFGSSESDPDILGAYRLGNGRRSIERAALALERAIDLVKPGGWVGIIIMDGILSNPSMSFVRDHVMRNVWVRGLISLAPETFEAYGGRSDTTIMLLEKKTDPDDGAQDPTFMAVCRNSGYAANGTEIPGNELPAILDAYKAWAASKSFSMDNAWVSSITGRLDPKHYWRPTPGADGLSSTDAVTAIESQVALLTAASSELHANLTSLAREIPTKTVALGELLEEVIDRYVVVPNDEYSLAGVRWWGGGAFIREVKQGSEIKTQGKISKLTKGTLIYNRLFAFRGSFAIVDAECDGAYASVEFPMYTPKDDVESPDLLLRYVVHSMNSPRYLAIVDADSSGSTKTSRNRFLQRSFESFQIALPTDEADMAELVDLMDRTTQIRRLALNMDGASKDLQDAVGHSLPMP